MSHDDDEKVTNDPTPGADQPDAEELPLDLAEFAEAVEFEPSDDVSFDVPPPPEAELGEHTIGMSLADLADIPGLGDLIPSAEPASGIPPLPVESFTRLVEDPSVDTDDLVPIDEAYPAADPASSTSLSARLDPPSGVNITADSSTKLAEMAEAADFDDVADLEDIAVVEPASGWFDSEADELATAEPPVAEATSATGLEPAAPGHQIESSDIFASGPVPSAEAADVSDVIAATTGSIPTAQLEDADDVPFGTTRPSDIALSFNEPPGGSTIAEASDDLPLADEAVDDVPVASAEEVLDSGNLAHAPEIPEIDETMDLGSTPAHHTDASSIMGELAGGTENLIDASGVRIEAPGMGRTLSDDPFFTGASKPEFDLTDLDQQVPPGLTGTDIHLARTEELAPPGSSNLFDATEPDVELPDAGKVDPFADAWAIDQPSLSSGQSSIFTGEKPENSTRTGGSNVPVAVPDPDYTDSVDFSDHPDLSGADSGSFHKGIPPAVPAAEADDDMIDWSAAEGHPESSLSGGASGILSSQFDAPMSGILSRGSKASSEDDDLLEVTAETQPAKSVPHGLKGRPASDPSVEVEWAPDSSDENAPLPSRKSGKGHNRTSDARTSPARPAADAPAKRGLDRVLGLALGLVVGTAVCAGLYLTGTIPNGEKAAPSNGSSTAASGDVATLTASLKEANDKAAAAENDLAAQQKTVSKLENDLKKQGDSVRAIEKQLMAERDMIAKLEKDAQTATDNFLEADKQLTVEKLAVAKLETALKTEKEAVLKTEKELKSEQELVAKLEKDVKAEKDAAVKLETDLLAKLKESTDLVATAEQKRNETLATLETVAKELQAKKLLPAKYDTAALLAATRDAAERATGPNLSTLFPTGMAAVGGNPLTAGQLIDIADRLGKAETDAAKARATLLAAVEKHEAEVKAIKEQQAADLKKIQDQNAADAKKLADTYAADTKKLQDTHLAELKKATDANGIAKLKEAHAAEMKKAGEQFEADKKKLLAEADVIADKLKDAHAKEVKSLELAIETEKQKAALMAKQFQADLGNAVSPAQTLDQWLTILTGLRRPADAEPALAAASKVLATAPPGSEDYAKAQTVHGLALLIKGETETAKTWFVQAKGSAAYKNVAGKAGWAKAADLGLASVDDPLAALRKPVLANKQDKAVGAKYLDAGIQAYRAGRYEDAEKALTEAAWHDDTNPLPWYFLGATHWQLGDTKRAMKDFGDGATREKSRSVTTRSIDLAISPIQGSARDALSGMRP